MPPDPVTGHPRAVQTPAEIFGEKQAWRARIRAARAIRANDAPAAEARVARCLEVSVGHAHVACYASTPGEPGTWGLIAGLASRGVRVLLPVLTGRRGPDWAWYSGADALRAGPFGILEPTSAPVGPQGLAGVTLVWASALAATPLGARLGTGGGWYDRALPHASADATVGVLIDDSEVVDTLPTNEFDRSVGVIVTPTRTLWTPHGRTTE